MLRNKSWSDKIKFLVVFIIFMFGIWNGYDRAIEYQEGQKQESQNDDVNNGSEDDANTDDNVSGKNEGNHKIAEDGTYTSKEEVAEYIDTYGKLPSNFITKEEARDLGWENSEGNLNEVAPGKSIGGDYFGNYEEKLPEKDGRDYYECDINYESGYRKSERIVYSNDGLIYYTADHYETFELLYGEE